MSINITNTKDVEQLIVFLYRDTDIGIEIGVDQYSEDVEKPFVEFYLKTDDYFKLETEDEKYDFLHTKDGFIKNEYHLKTFYFSNIEIFNHFFKIIESLYLEEKEKRLL